jgi:hypothetical protein
MSGRTCYWCTKRNAARAALVAACVAIAAAAQAAGWSSFGGNAQHTGVSSTPAQPLATVRWSTPVDLAPPAEPILIHYGSPVITAANTVVIPVKTGASDGYRIDARKGGDGTRVWTAATDYVAPPHAWIPSYGPTIAAGNRVYFAGAGGTILYRDTPDAAVPANSGRLAFYGLSAWLGARADFSSTVYVNTPITTDADGTLWFGFRTTANAPLGLVSGIARIDAAGNGTWISAAAIAGDAAVTRVPHQAAPALSNDGRTLYVVVAEDNGVGHAYLVGIDPATLAPREIAPGVPMRATLKDPRAANLDPLISDNSSASPMVGPDGDVYYGVLGNPQNGSRGWMLHYSGDLATTKTPGAFGWDNTAAVVPASMVPSYAGGSSYLIFSKYNDYAGSDGGQGVNRIAVLDPNDTMVEPHPSSNGTRVMKEVLTIAGPTPDADAVVLYPNAVVEWCINAAAIDPATKSVMANSEDGKLYRWDLATNTLSQAVTLSAGVGEAYTTTLIGPDGTVYATNWAILNAVGGNGVAPVVTGASSRKVHGSPGTRFDLVLASTPSAPTIEPRSGGASGRHSIVFTFDRPPLAGVATVTAGTAVAGTPVFSGSEMIVPLSGVADAQYVTVAVRDVASIDGGAGGSGSVRTGFLVGDVDASGSVLVADLLQVKAVLTQPVTGLTFLRDVNASGTLSIADMLIVNANLTRALPPP